MLTSMKDTFHAIPSADGFKIFPNGNFDAKEENKQIRQLEA